MANDVGNLAGAVVGPPRQGQDLEQGRDVLVQGVDARFLDGAHDGDALALERLHLHVDAGVLEDLPLPEDPLEPGLHPGNSAPLDGNVAQDGKGDASGLGDARLEGAGLLAELPLEDADGQHVLGPEAIVLRLEGCLLPGQQDVPAAGIVRQRLPLGHDDLVHLADRRAAAPDRERDHGEQKVN